MLYPLKLRGPTLGVCPGRGASLRLLGPGWRCLPADGLCAPVPRGVGQFLSTVPTRSAPIVRLAVLCPESKIAGSREVVGLAYVTRRSEWLSCLPTEQRVCLGDQWAVLRSRAIASAVLLAARWLT
jgi:hypothetical protein